VDDLAFVFTGHALDELARRQISEAQVLDCLAKPGQSFAIREGRVVYQCIFQTLIGRRWLLRIFVDVDRKPAQIVTVYRTSKIKKYWRREPL
jgi:hypothetical protein